MADQDVPTLTDLASDLAGEADVKEEPTEQEAVATESSTAEETPPEAETESADAEESESSEEEAEPEAPTEEDQQFSKAEQRKAELNTEIRDLLSTRTAIRQEVESLTAQAYKAQTPDEIMAETGQDPADARISAMEQREELRNWNNQVADAQLTIGTESQRIVQDFPIFDETKPDYVPQVAVQAAQLLEQNLIRDPNVPEYVNGQQTGKGIVIGSHVSPYSLYKTIADAHQASAVANQVAGQKSAEKMMSVADAPSSSTPRQPKEDPFLAGLTRGMNGGST